MEVGGEVWEGVKELGGGLCREEEVLGRVGWGEEMAGESPQTDK